jgi:hypothetical protein
MTRRLPTTWLLLGSTLLVPAADVLAQGCAMCGSSFEPNDPATRAINASVLFMLLAPYSLLAAVGGWLYFRYRRSGPSKRATVVALPWVRTGMSGRAPEEE